ncbi:rCG64446, partial [Rattus norvegicus]
QTLGLTRVLELGQNSASSQ